VRDEALEYFAKNRIVWHSAALPGLPSNHLCSSQILAVNLFMPFRSRPDALKALFGPYLPIDFVLPFQGEDYLAFEWIGGDQNFLMEESKLGGSRMRGAGTTSIDLAFLYHSTTGRRVLVLAEVKYTEQYSAAPLRFRSDGSDRAQTYGPFYHGPNTPFDLGTFGDLDALLVDPFAQMLRQQLMAAQILAAGSLPVDEVKVLQLYCGANKGLRTVTSPPLRQFGSDTYSVWKSLLLDPGTFDAITLEDLLSCPIEKSFPELRPWRVYLRDRYRGIF